MIIIEVGSVSFGGFWYTFGGARKASPKNAFFPRLHFVNSVSRVGVRQGLD